MLSSAVVWLWLRMVPSLPLNKTYEPDTLWDPREFSSLNKRTGTEMFAVKMAFKGLRIEDLQRSKTLLRRRAVVIISSKSHILYWSHIHSTLNIKVILCLSSMAHTYRQVSSFYNQFKFWNFKISFTENKFSDHFK